MHNGAFTQNSVPRVSVRIPSYNHEAYVAACIQSVLDQTFQDFEIVVTDDASTDRTADIVRSFDDPRIHLEVLSKNQGISAAIANACGRARGEYIANLCSDDQWAPEKLEKQVAYLDAHPETDAVLTRARLIGEQGEWIEDHSLEQVFNEPNRSRNEWLRRFFYLGNCLCMPSAMIRADVYRNLGWQDVRFASLPDLDFWVRFSMAHDLFILDESLTDFRVRADEANASSNNMDNLLRVRIESMHILDRYLELRSPEQLLAALPEAAVYGTPEAEDIPYFLARVALDGPEDYHWLWGLNMLHWLLNDPERRQRLEHRFAFTPKLLHVLGGQRDPLHLNDVHTLQAELDTAILELASISRQRDDALLQVKQNEAQIKELKRINKATTQWASELKQDQSELQQQLQQMRASVSWRLTAPLRAIRSRTGKTKNEN